MVRRERARRATELERNVERQQSAAQIEESRQRCQPLAGFIREAWHVLEPGRPYVDGWHTGIICAHLEALSNGTFLDLGYDNRLIINVPPGTMKSLTVSVFWQAWLWGPRAQAHLRFLSSAYGEHLVKRDARRTRDLIESEWFQTRWPMPLPRRGETSFGNSHTGTREGRPYTSLTGDRGDMVPIDDPHSTEKAESDADRKTAIRITRESLTSRVNDPVRSPIVIMMQRLHSQDVTAQLLVLWPSYIHIMLPMEFEPERCCYTPLPNPDAPKPCRARYIATKQMWFRDDWKPDPENDDDAQYVDEFQRAKTQIVYRWDPRREAGELLNPERFPQNVVDRDKISLGTYGTAGQMQQRPTPREGGMLSRGMFPFVRPAEVPNDCEWVRHWDLAGTKKRQGNNPAWTVGLLLGRSRLQKTWFIKHVARDRLEPGGVETLIANTAMQDFAEYGINVEISLPKDPGQAGKGQIVRFMGLLAAFRVHAEAESGNKIVRAGPVISQAEAGMVSIVINENGSIPPWVEPFLSEMDMVPAGFLDQLDALSGAYTRHTTRPSGTVRTVNVTSHR